MVRVSIGDERARIYPEGGIGFDKHVKGIGWIVNDRPGAVIAALAIATRKRFLSLAIRGK